MICAAAALAGCDPAAVASSIPRGACTVIVDAAAALTGIPPVSACHAHGGLVCMYDPAAVVPKVVESDGGTYYAVARCDRCTGPTLRGLGSYCEPPPERDMGTIRIEQAP